MQRVFASIENNKVVLSEKDERHLRHVLRLKVGEEVEVVSEGKSYLSRVSRIEPFALEIVAPITENRELDHSLTLAWSLLKGENNDWIVMKGTELGVTEFLPFISDRTIIKADLHKEDNRLLRMRKIVESSSMQCRRSIIPEVKEYQKLSEVLDLPFDHKIIAYEGMNGESKTLIKLMKGVQKGESILLLIGPEGGFSEKEVALCVEKGCEMVSLGRRILRAETAAIYGAALLGALSEEE
jgi:16S rRNA (uracil1498-N3)-methyltransferase